MYLHIDLSSMHRINSRLCLLSLKVEVIEIVHSQVAKTVYPPCIFPSFSSPDSKLVTSTCSDAVQSVTCRP